MAFSGTVRSSYAAERAAGRLKRRRRSLLTLAASALGAAAGRLFPSWAALRTLVLTLAAFGLIDTAAWQWHTWAGLVVTGLSLLVLEWLTSGGDG